MDDATKKMVTGLGATAIKNTLMSLGPVLAAHGVIASNQTETFVSSGMFVVGIMWSFWDSYGRVIFLAKMEVWKAKALAQAAALHANGIPPVTVEQIAAKGPEAMTPASVAKVAATLCLLLAFGLMVSPAFAQRADDMARATGVRAAVKLPIDPLGLNNRVGTGSPLNDLLGALDVKLLPDLQYALKLAEASGSKVTGPCYKAWIDIIMTRQTAVKDGDNAIPLPDPHLVTDFEKLVELRNSLQPESPFMIACSPVASMVKKDILGFIGTVIGGGAGLATLVPGL